MPRSQFEECVATPPKQRADAPAGGSACAGFPLWRSGEEYVSLLDSSVRASGVPEGMAQGATRWPIRERRLQTRVHLRTETLSPMRGSALPSFQMQARDPEAASAYVEFIQRYGTAFVAGDSAACKRGTPCYSSPANSLPRCCS